MLTGLALIPMLTSVVVSILASQRTREAREEELRHLTLILERLDTLERRFGELAALEIALRSSAQARATQRKPMCEVEVSTVSLCRAAGR